MASEEQKTLSNFLKEVHSSLRKETSKMGARQAWQEHCSKTDLLLVYAEAMQKLATTHWALNCADESKAATSRIKWASDLCYEYFVKKTCKEFYHKEIMVAKKIEGTLNIEEELLLPIMPIKLLDVGSCYNPFRIYDYLDVLAIDLCPANDNVKECDFLNVSTGPELVVESCKVRQLPECSYDVITFCFLLEYLPSSELRITSCEKAYDLLKPGGLLIIITPDSKHVGANSKIMKCWRYTFANLGFTRIKYQKLKHMHCMGFRKALWKVTAIRWANIHKEPYMEHALHIPQDFRLTCQQEIPLIHTEVYNICEDFLELPFIDS